MVPSDSVPDTLDDAYWVALLTEELREDEASDPVVEAVEPFRLELHSGEGKQCELTVRAIARSTARLAFAGPNRTEPPTKVPDSAESEFVIYKGNRYAVLTSRWTWSAPPGLEPATQQTYCVICDNNPWRATSREHIETPAVFPSALGDPGTPSGPVTHPDVKQ